MQEIIEIIKTYKEDNPHVYITESMIKAVIEENIDLIISDIRKDI